MALVTGNYVTAAGVALPAGAAPRIDVIPSKPAVTSNGRLISEKPRTVTVGAGGAFSIDLIPTVDVLDDDFHYLIRGYYLAGDGDGTRVDLFEHRLYVPTQGGQIGELDGIPTDITFDAWVFVDPTWTDANPPAMTIPGAYYLSAHPNDPALGTGTLWKAVE